MNQREERDKRNPVIRFTVLVFILVVLVLSVPFVLKIGEQNPIGTLEGMVLIIGFLILSLMVGLILVRKSRPIQPLYPLLEKITRLIEGPAIAVSILLVILISLEAGLRLYARANPIKRLYWYTMDIRSNDYTTLINNPAYQGAPYATTDFFEESLDPRVHTITNDPEHGFIVPMNFSGDYINVVDHQRITVNQPSETQPTIYIFGGSTIFNVAVPDQYTVSSHLQELINKKSAGEYRVVNLGVIGVTTNQQLLRLVSLDLKDGDIVIFYDGFNDILENMDRNIGPFTNALMKFHIINTFVKPAFPAILPPYEIQDADNLRLTFQSNLVAADAFCAQHGVEFIHFLQPSLLLVQVPSEYETTLLNTIEQHSPGWTAGFQRGYGILEEVNQSLQDDGVITVDLRNIFNHDQRNYPGEIFLDDIHVNHIGNQIIAHAIFEDLEPHLSAENSAQ